MSSKPFSLGERITNPDRKAILTAIRSHCASIWSSGLWVHPQSVIHGDGHSAAIIKVLERILEPYMAMRSCLNEGEILILLSAALAHDVGYLPMEPAEIYDFDYARANHPERSQKYISDNVQVFNDRAGPLIGLCARGHRDVPMKKDEYDDKMLGDDNIRLQFLTALLRLADELDLSVDRAPKPFYDQIKQYYGKLSDFTILQWMRHYYTEGIRIVHSVKDGTLHIRFSIFSYIPTKEYETYVVEPWIVGPIKRAILDTYDALARESIILETDVGYQTIVNPAKEQLPSDLFLRQQRSVLDLQIERSLLRYDYRRVFSFIEETKTKNHIFDSPVVRIRNSAEYSLFNNSNDKTWLAAHGAFLVLSRDLFANATSLTIDEDFIEQTMGFSMNIEKDHTSSSPELQYIRRETIKENLESAPIQVVMTALEGLRPFEDKIVCVYEVKRNLDLVSIHCRYLKLEPIQPGERVRCKYSWDSTVLPWDSLSTSLMHYTKNIDFKLEKFPKEYWMKTTANLLMKKGFGVTERLEPNFRVLYGEDATYLRVSEWLAPGTQISTVWKDTRLRLEKRNDV